MSPLRLNGSTSGFSQLDAPAIAGDQTFTLPGTGGTLDRINRAGNILQVVENSSSTAQSGITAATSILTASITPSSASNKIIVIGHISYTAVPNTNAYGQALIYRGTTSGTQVSVAYGGHASATNIDVPSTCIAFDSPATTSSQTYTLAIARGSGSTTSVATNGTYRLILMEVAA